ncbi:Superfamily I DNA and RNA helicase and helicase subunits [Microbacterium sp. C448]|uniref:TM0106 family RecB-like putative nuclease n=1 Tax=Microbacterium sp. C448 TaxID=1177594 RepID=UPI0003DE0798|nr:bifunctional RecB family nuclease/DEAD/DEAH box helicase [Microbacterium sp. C448]CDK01454.1 Superfamily I DNA and RNA helicase and helicase subunits [Microbacterium sp. C448]
MRYIENEGRLVTSASDLKAASECEFAWVRAIDARLGRVPQVVEPEDLTLERAARLGDRHEQRVLDEYLADDPDGVATIEQVSSGDALALAEAVRLTNAALADPSVRIIYQAAFATRDFVGFADFLVRDENGRWLVQDTKLARRARVTALMQLAAYVERLDDLGVERSDRVELLLGDRTTSSHLVDDILPVYRLRYARLIELIESRQVELGAGGAPTAWGDDRYFACGRCATCQIEVEASRDLLLVAGMRPLQRTKLRAAGIRTLDDLSVAQTPPSTLNADVFGLLRTQAQLQRASEIAATDAPDAVPAPVYSVVDRAGLAALPPADPGDLFFDFEGDPLYTEGTGTGTGTGTGASTGTEWGIDYLFGWVDESETFSRLWAHSFAEERLALQRFLDFVDVHRAAHPGMHIYHYAPYEPTHLLAMAARHGTGEAQVDRLLRDGVFIDLYPIVRRALRVGSRSYSIKKLEPLYMGDETRQSDVQRGDESIVRYVEARMLQDAGDDEGARAILDDIADYNRYDCVSTRRLRNWLRDRADELGIVATADPEPDAAGYEPSPRAVALIALAESADGEDAAALRLGSAAIDYYPREAKSYWATHFLRLREPVSVWEQSRDVAVLDASRCEVVEDWHRAEGHRVDRRILRLRGELAPGTRLSPGSEPFLLYELPAPFVFEASPRWLHADHRGRVVEELEDGAIIEERARGGFTWGELPIAITPGSPPRALSQQVAIDEWADRVIAASPAFPTDAATDLLRRRPPRLRAGHPVAADPTDPVPAIVATLRDLDRSYLAVQGPPGTGKTYVGSHVIEHLVREHAWKIGVVAQSHAVVEHMLDRIIDAGVPAARVGKAPKDDSVPVRFTPLQKNGVAAFADEHAQAGFVVGGTAWDFSHEGRFPRGSLDLLVIDEAGQFSLASTIAVSVAAQRLLLLGDPQQLPQVSQGTHPEPVDTSALGWIMDGSAVLPDAFGYFLPESRRMHPLVALPVSNLSYAGRLASHRSAALRSIDGVEPGLHRVPIEHHGNATASVEEAAAVVDLVRGLIGTSFTDLARDGGEPRLVAPRLLTGDDIIIVTPYNAQAATVLAALAEAQLPPVRVGTVDKFQGQEAAVSIVSLAASSGRDAPRGLEFLLLANRLNVAISRAEVAAFLVYSPGLLDDLPHTPEGVARLSGFARLVEDPGASSARPRRP